MAQFSLTRAGLTLAVLGLLTTFGHAGTIRHDTASNLYLTAADLPAFQSVGQIDGTSTTIGDYFASGTLIGSQWVLTAAHVVDRASSLTFNINGASYTGDYWATPPQWNPGGFFRMITGYDIGLIHLSQPVADVTPAQLYTGSAELGQPVAMVGYGETGTGLTGATDFDGLKRAGLNTIDSFFLGSAGRIFLTDFDNPNSPADSLLGSSSPLPLEYLIAPGDSGGGAFILDNGHFVLAGVHSFLLGLDLTSNSDYGDISGHTRVSMHLGWINETVTGDVPEPHSALLLLAGVAAVAVRRRRA